MSLIDLIDFSLYYLLEEKNRKIYRPTKLIDELNLRFKQHNIGYEFIGDELIKISDQTTHEQIVKPALKLLMDEDFRGAEEEYYSAFSHYKNDNYKEAIVDAGKAFESTMKIICAKKGYAFRADKDDSKKLIAILIENEFFPKYLESHMSGVRTTLESGAPTVRNKIGGHGQGASVSNPSEAYVKYVLNLVATNMAFLYGIYKNP